MSITNKFRMFRYPQKIYSTTQSKLVGLWCADIDGRVSESEFYENGYRGSEYPKGPDTLDYLLYYSFCLIVSILAITAALPIIIAAFVWGVLVDAFDDNIMGLTCSCS